MLKKILGNEGYDVIDAGDGHTAIQRALEELPDVVLLDIEIPEKNGFDVCAELKGRDDFLNTSIMFISARSEARTWAL